MNFNNFIKYFESDNVEQGFDQIQDRRNILKGFASKVAVASVPFVATSLFSNKAQAQSKESIIIALNYLLRPHYIAEKIYQETANAGLESFPEDFKANFNNVVNYNKEQIKILQGVISDLGGTAIVVDPATIDITAGAGTGTGPFFGSINTFDKFLILAQSLSDATSRIYKDQVTRVLSDNETVRAIMNIQTVKAREASFFRFWRRFWYGVDMYAWISGTEPNSTIPFVQNAYNGEGVTIQNGITVTDINGFDISEATATQAFDEPLDKPLGEAFINRFIDED